MFSNYIAMMEFQTLPDSYTVTDSHLNLGRQHNYIPNSNFRSTTFWTPYMMMFSIIVISGRQVFGCSGCYRGSRTSGCIIQRDVHRR